MAVAVVFTVIFCVIKVAAAVAGGGTDCNDGRYYIREDPTSCTHFYKCDNGNPVLFPCPGNLYYNPATHNCDWPYNVKCDVNKGQQNGNGGTEQYDSNSGRPNNGGNQYNDNNGYSYHNGGNYDGNNGYPSNNGGQYNGNNGSPSNNGGQYNGNNGSPSNNEGQYNSGSNYNNGQYNGNQDGSNAQGYYNQNENQFSDGSYLYPSQPVHAQDPEIGPSINEPDGIFDGDRPRPTIDDIYSSDTNPYQDFVNPGFDIRK